MPIDLVPNGISFGADSTGKEQLKLKFCFIKRFIRVYVYDLVQWREGRGREGGKEGGKGWRGEGWGGRGP